jgi:hypothetical protein
MSPLFSLDLRIFFIKIFEISKKISYNIIVVKGTKLQQGLLLWVFERVGQRGTQILRRAVERSLGSLW